MYPFCDEVGKYEKLMKVGQGTFGEVYKAKDRKSSRLVALKKILVENEQEVCNIVFFIRKTLSDHRGSNSKILRSQGKFTLSVKKKSAESE